MGEVYRARDTRLERDVAIKVLPPAFAADPERLRRFRQEARAIAALNHPHICQLFDVGPDYLVMEFVDGRPLGGPMPPSDAVALAIQIASALEEAHRKGVIHRDVKPGNVLVTAGGGAKLLDFGIARMDAAGTDVTLSSTATIVGTVAYMSPEQVEGRPLDVRSDIFSFGAVLYEMLSGVRAFRGDSAAQVMAAVLRDDPPPVGVPALEPVVRRCLSRRAAQRYQTMTEVRAALEEAARPAAGGPLARRPAIAVLPLANLSSDPENEYFGDGLAEEIINALTRIPELKVIARTSAFAFKGTNTDVRKIADTLGVSHVLDGSVRRAGARIRVTAQLIAASDGSHLWSERYDRELADVFQIQDDIAQSIASALRVTLTSQVERALAKRSTENVDAHHLYLKGRFQAAKRTAGALGKAIEHYRSAIEIDPACAIAYAGLGECYVPLAFYGHMLPRDAWLKASAAARQALELDPRLPEARAVLARARLFTDRDPAGSTREYRDALELDPDYSRARQGMAENLVALGRFDEAAAQIARAVQSDPLALPLNAAVGLIAYFSRRYDEAIAAFRRTLEMDAYFYPAHWLLGLALEQTGALADAESSLTLAATLSDHSTQVTAGLGGVYAAGGQTNRARAVLDNLRQQGERQYVSRLLRAVILMRLGDREAALDLLDGALEDQCPWLLFAAVDPRLDPVRAQPRFQTLLQLMGLEAVQR
jgi:serine/threonine-protein kinase